MYTTAKHNRTLAVTVLLALIVALLFTSLTSCRTGDGENTGSNTVTATGTAFGTTTSDAQTTVSPSTTDSITTKAPETTETAKVTDTTSAPAVTTDPITLPVTTGTKEPETTLPPVIAETSGVFYADTGTSLGFRVEWELVGFEDDKAIIKTRVILSSYQLYISARNNLGIIQFGDNQIRFSTARITQEQNKKVDILLTEQQVKVDTDNGFAVVHFEVRWFFNANYAGTDYEWIGAGGYISLNKE